MRLPLSWLRELVPIEAEPDELAARLTMAGLSVEQIIRTGAGISGVVVGEVRAKRPHPGSDRLMLVRASDGSIERDIVCGANNYEPGDRVPLAVPGARLPGGMEIAQREVLGQVSDGMLCSPQELEIADDHSGIMILDADAPVGKDLVSALELDDVIFDVDVTGNRPDCLSVLGIAREVALLYDLPLTLPDVHIDENGEPVEELASVTVSDRKGCPRYVARVLSGVRIGPSPWWMRRRLLASGMRPISNVVDVTNYVMLELGQPQHAFDLATLTGRAIVVRKPKRGERSLTTLDGQERVLARDDLLICDAERPVGLAGVMGGAESEVSEATTELLLESAYFSPDRIAGTVRRLDMRTEASVRFEHGIDPARTGFAADRAAALFAQLAGATVARGAIDIGPTSFTAKPIRFRPARAQLLIGADVPATESLAWLTKLGATVAGSGKTVRVTPPTWRPDITLEENLVEEVARLYGYERVPERLPHGSRSGVLTHDQTRRRVAAAALRDRGLNEAQTLSLLPPWIGERIGLPDGHPWRTVARLANPLSEEESVLRPSLLPGLLLAAQRNVARRVLPASLFEIGRIFVPAGEQVDETVRIAWVLTGPAPTSWHEPERALDFFDAKGALEGLLGALGIEGWTIRAAEPVPPFHPGRIAEVLVHGARIGVVAELHPRAADALELPARVAVCELDLDPLTAAPGGRTARQSSRFPGVRRDVALVVPVGRPSSDVEQVVRAAAGDLLDRIVLFDVYRGDRIPEGTVSLAFALTLRAPDRTLTDEDADGVMNAIVAAAAAEGWSIRE